jgi:pimeloyl-ACP methyl ester carboxylesterase
MRLCENNPLLAAARSFRIIVYLPPAFGNSLQFFSLAKAPGRKEIRLFTSYVKGRQASTNPLRLMRLCENNPLLAAARSFRIIVYLPPAFGNSLTIFLSRKGAMPQRNPTFSILIDIKN